MVYNQEYYRKNKGKFLVWQREYRQKNHGKILENRKKYDKDNHEHQLKLKREWRKGKGKEKNKKSKQKTDAKYYAKVKHDKMFLEKKHIRGKNYYQNNIDKIKQYQKKHNQIPEVKTRRNELARIRNRLNPKSNRRGSIELQLAMNNVRKRDHNTCQWAACGLSFRQVPIHVHHIFPRSEYPNFELIEQYMICYCANHHGLWHRMRGDKYSEMIGARYQEDGIKSLEVIY